MDGAEGGADGDLLVGVKAGDAAAFELLYDRHSRAAYGLAYRILGEATAAEDVVQEAFLTVWRQAATYGPERGTVRAWLLAIVHHRAIDHVRRRSYREERQQALDAVADPPDSADTWEQARQSVEGQHVREALEHLPPDQRRSITLAYFGGYTHDEIARLLGVPLGTVKGRLRIGLQKMRGYLDKQGVEAPG
jgi:RNA polymerase sigma-70 factor, ECF subfamily